MAEEYNRIVTTCNSLQRFWLPRNEKFKIWYELIQMVDNLKQKNFESFVGNDPQASFKLIRHLLDQKIPHRIPSEMLTVENVAMSADVEKIYDTCWSDIYYNYRMRGKQGWLWDLIGFLLATGWYNVFATLSPDGRTAIAEIWNPATVFPNWDMRLVECAHILTLNPTEARGMILRNNWPIDPPKTSSKLYDLWEDESNGTVYNSIVLAGKVVKPRTEERYFNRIPIFTSPVGGLPDTGVITDSSKWKEDVGHALPTTNENIYKYWNKWWSMSMQALRKSVQAQLKEKSSGGKPIVKPEEVDKYGAIFRMGQNDDVDYLAPPPIPVEIRSTQIDMEAMMQRGGPSWAMFGSVAGGMTAYIMAQIAAATNQVARPYHQGVIDCITDIDNFWFWQMKTFGFKPYKLALPKNLPDDIRISAEYEIRIPGDLIQRLTAARMADPQFRLSPDRVMEELFPEIKNPIRELALVRSGDAKRNPINSIIDLILAFRQEAELLRRAGDTAAASLYDKAAATVEAQLSPPPQAVAPSQAQSPVRPPIGNRAEAITPEQQQLLAQTQGEGAPPPEVPV